MCTAAEMQMNPDLARRVQKRRSMDELANEITRLAGHLNAGNYRFLKLIAEFDSGKGWAGDGATQSCAHWLNWKCGVDIGAAREKVRVAHALADLPKIAAAMERGELSYSKVRALTRVACEGTEDYFLSIAQHGTANHVETLVRHYRRAQEAEELSREARQQANRALGYYFDHDGCMVLKARLPAEVGALFIKALDAALKESDQAMSGNLTVGVSAETSTSVQTRIAKRANIRIRRADALGLMAESFLKHGADEMNGGDRNQIVVHVSAETLRDKTAGCCEIEHGPSVAAETSRRLGCDSSIVMLVEDEKGQPLNVGRKTRTISAPLRRALSSRDKGCRFPGCCNKRYIDGHHVKHWANGGETNISNLVSLCRFHHRAVHEGGVQIQVLDDGAFRFIKPNGDTFDSIAEGFTQPISDWSELPRTNGNQGIHINSKTAVTRWCGETMDYGLGVQVLLQQHYKHKDRNVSAETSSANRAE
jgi:hypothetical protein